MMARTQRSSQGLSAPDRGDAWRRLRRWLGGSYSPYLFIAPFFLLFGALGLYPLLYALRLSFTNWHGYGSPRFIGWDNYTFLLGDADFWASLGNSATLWALIVPGQLVFAVAIARLLSAPRLRLRGLFRTAFITPFVVPLVAVAQIWTVLFDADFGTVNSFLRLLHLPAVGWLTTVVWAKPTLAILVLWKGSGFAILIMLAALQGIPESLYEAAAIDGAGTAVQFWLITLPLLRRAILFYLITSTFGVVQMFAEPYVVTHGGPYNSTMTAGLYLYNHIGNEDLGTGAANSFLLVILVLTLAAVLLRLLRSEEV